MSESRKGEGSYWYGKKFPQLMLEKLSRSRKGRIASEETKAKLRLAHLGEKNGFYNKKHSTESREKMRLAQKRLYEYGYINPMTGVKGELSPNWHGGKSFEPYGTDFNSDMREKIRQKYNYRCQECFRHQDELRTKDNRHYKLNIHHIDYNKKNNQESNLIPLCKECHAQTGFNRLNWINYFNNKITEGEKNV